MVSTKLALLLLTTSLGLSYARNGLQTFGNTCEPNGTSRAFLCNAELGLGCTERKICLCKPFQDAHRRESIQTVYSKNVCRVRANETCSFERDGALKQYECLHHGWCEYNVCACKHGYKASSDGTECRSSGGRIIAGEMLVSVLVLVSAFGVSHIL